MNSEMYKAYLGGRIRAARRAHGISVEKFALMVGIDRNYLRAVEYGRANPTIDILVKIADGLGLHVWELMTPDESDRDEDGI